MKKYSTTHIREKPLTEQASLAHLYYRRARKAEDELEHTISLLREQQKENEELRGAIIELFERTAA